MARAMRASGDLKPNATLVMRRILVLTDSMRPLDSPCSIAARIEALCLTMRRCRSTKVGDAAAAGPADPRLERLDGFVVAELEDQPEAFLEQVGTVQHRVGLGDPGELGLLPGGEVLGVLPQRKAGVLERLRGAGGVLTDASTRPSDPVRAAAWSAAGGVPGLAADVVEGLGGPLDDVEGVGAADRVRTPVGDHGADPVRAVGTDVGDLGAALLPEGVEEPVEGGLLLSVSGPHQLPGVVVDHHRQGTVRYKCPRL